MSSDDDILERQFYSDNEHERLIAEFDSVVPIRELREENERLRFEVARLHEALSAKSTQLHDALSGAPDDPDQRIIIERDLDGWVIGDDEGEFARTGSIAAALRYVEDLMHGPGTGPRAMLDAQRKLKGA